MFSSQGLEDWELVVVSGMLAIAAMAISTVIGLMVAYLALRESAPATIKEAATEKAPSNSIPRQAMDSSEPVGAGGNRRVAVG
jgi:hypothetical protein